MRMYFLTDQYLLLRGILGLWDFDMAAFDLILPYMLSTGPDRRISHRKYRIDGHKAALH